MKPLSIKTKLLLYNILVFSALIFIFTFVIFHNSNTVIKSAAQRNAEQIINSARNNMITLIDDINYEMTALQSNKTIQNILTNTKPSNPIDDINTLKDTLMEVDIFKRKVSNVELYALYKDEYPSVFSKNIVFSCKELKNDAWYKTIIANKLKTIWFVFDNAYTDNSFINASRLIIDSNTGNPLAIAKFDIAINTFTDKLKDIRLADTGRVVISTSTHIVNPDQDPLIKSLVNHKEIFGGLLNDSKETKYIDIDGDECLISIYPLKDTGLYIIGAVKLKEFETNSKPILNAIIITSSLMLLVSLISLTLVSSYITRPIINLANTMRNFRLDDELPVRKKSGDEIGVLYKSFYTMKSTINNLIDDVNTSSMLYRNAELKALQAQIAPHFLYNTFNSIVAMAHKYNALDIENMVSDLASFFSHSLNNGNELTTIRNEIEHTISYLNIQKHRFGDIFNLTIDIDEDILDCQISKLTLQPLVENCIVHAFDQLSGSGEIKITGGKQDDDIYISVSDNGLGVNIVNIDELNTYCNKQFDPNEPIDKYGIHNVNFRIKLYFGNKYGISYKENKEGGLTVTVHIPRTLGREKHETINC